MNRTILKKKLKEAKEEAAWAKLLLLVLLQGMGGRVVVNPAALEKVGTRFRLVFGKGPSALSMEERQRFLGAPEELLQNLLVCQAIDMQEKEEGSLLLGANGKAMASG